MLKTTLRAETPSLVLPTVSILATSPALHVRYSKVDSAYSHPPDLSSLGSLCSKSFCPGTDWHRHRQTSSYRAYPSRIYLHAALLLPTEGYCIFPKCEQQTSSGLEYRITATTVNNSKGLANYIMITVYIKSID